MCPWGGDYARFQFINKNKLIFIICGVTGRGVSAALLVNAFNTEFERLAREGKTPGVLFKKEDQILLFTDGVIEAKGIDGKEYGDDRQEDFNRQNNNLKAEAFNQGLLKELNSFTGNKLNDDVFILNIKTK